MPLQARSRTALSRGKRDRTVGGRLDVERSRSAGEADWAAAVFASAVACEKSRNTCHD